MPGQAARGHGPAGGEWGLPFGTTRRREEATKTQVRRTVSQQATVSRNEVPARRGPVTTPCKTIRRISEGETLTMKTSLVRRIATILAIALVAPASFAATYTVNQGSGPFNTVGAALAAAQGAGDTAAVIDITDSPAVIYAEAITIATTNTVINGNGNTLQDATNSAIGVNVPGVQLNGLIQDGGRTTIAAGADLTVTGCTFQNAANNAIVVNGTSLTATDTVFNNAAFRAINGNAGSVTVNGCTFINCGVVGGINTAALRVIGPSLDCQNSTFTTNATGIEIGPFAAVEPGTYNIDDCDFIANGLNAIGLSNSLGGGGDYTSRIVNITNCTATGDGGGFVNIDRDYAVVVPGGSDNATVAIDGCDFQGFPGGVISLIGVNTDLDIANSTLGASTVDAVISLRGGNHSVNVADTDIIGSGGNGAVMPSGNNITVNFTNVDIINPNTFGINMNVGDNNQLTMTGGSITHGAFGALPPVVFQGALSINPAFTCTNSTAILDGVNIANMPGVQIGEWGQTGHYGNRLELNNCTIDNVNGPHASFMFFDVGNEMIFDNTVVTNCSGQGFITIHPDTGQGGTLDDLSGLGQTTITLTNNASINGGPGNPGSGIWHLSGSTNPGDWAKWPDVSIVIDSGAGMHGFGAWAISKSDTGILTATDADVSLNARGFVLNGGMTSDVTLTNTSITTCTADAPLEIEAPMNVSLNNVDMSGSAGNGMIVWGNPTITGSGVDLSDIPGSVLWIVNPGGATINLDDVTMVNGGNMVVLQSPDYSSVTLTNSTLSNPAGGFVFGSGINGTDVALVDCTFGNSNGRAFPVDFTDWNVSLIRPTFTDRIGDVGVSGGGFLGSFSIVGEPANKVDLTPTYAGGTVLFARLCGGTLNLTDVTNSLRAAPLVDSLFEGAFGTTLTVNVDRCEFTNGGGDLVVGGASDGTGPIEPGFGTIVNVTNTIFNGTPSNAVIDTATDASTRTVPAEVNLTHVTFTGTNTGGWLSGNTPDEGDTVEDVFNMSYCIFDNSQGAVLTGPPDGTVASVSVLPASGDRNIIYDVTPLVGVGGFTRGEGNLTNTIKADPQLASDGRLAASAGPAFEAAMGSTTAVDIDGDVRPQAIEPDIGADEAIFVNSAESWSLFQ